MTFAWYGHLKKLSGRPVLVAVVISWGIAFFECLIQAPANRIGYTVLSVDKLKIIQETVSREGLLIRAGVPTTRTAETTAAGPR
jgi:uncharacterized protein (DUF486 family)